MKPVLVLQHLHADGPAWLGEWLQRQGLAFEVCNSEAGQEFPQDLGPWSALAVLGGEMSANDPMPSLRQAERLILQGIERGVPVLGHCLGGQLMARALGARIAASPAPEVGWQPMQVLPGAASSGWFGPPGAATVFQWHYEAFDLPPGATSLASSASCEHQAFAIGPHLAMQFHIEIDEDKLMRWADDTGSRYLDALAAHPASVQTGQAMRDAMARHLAAHQALAARIYRRWIEAARAA